MGIFLSLLDYNAFVIDFFLACLLFLLPLERRSRFPLRAALCLVVQFIVYQGVNLADPLFLTSTQNTAWPNLPAILYYFLMFILSFLAGVGTFFFCARLPINDAIFGAACAYAVQHMSYMIYSFCTVLLIPDSQEKGAVEILFFLCTAVPCYFLFAQKMPVAGSYHVTRQEAVRSAVIILFFALFLSMLVNQAQGFTENLMLFLICRIYAFLCCLFVLWAQTSIKEIVAVRAQLQAQQVLAQKQKEQYELSRDNIDIINQKCHDLKHQIAALRGMRGKEQFNAYLDKIEDSVMIYDSVVKTGNEVLDTILTERSLNCEREGISWTCMADGARLGFIDPIDLYTIFGNALDNAIECVRGLVDPEQRVVAVNVFSKPGVIILQIENYYQKKIEFSNNLPVTSKGDKDFHGFGLKSIRNTAEKYGGSVSIDTENNIFMLSVVIPIP